jgi:probable blue pigment (indigoidine) exporter
MAETEHRYLDAGLCALGPAIWGSTYLVTTEMLPEDAPLLAATVRALPAGLILLAIGRVLPSGQWWWRSLVLGTLNIGAFFYLLFVSAYLLPGGVAALVIAMQPMLVLLLGSLLLRERIRLIHFTACVLGFAGVALLVLRSDTTLHAGGIAAALAGAVCMAVGIVLTKRWGRPDGVGLLDFTGWQLAAGGLVLLPMLLAFEGLPASVNGTNLLGFGYLSILGAVFSYAVWFRGIERLPALAVSFLALASPLVATGLGWVALDESLTLLQLLGAAIIIGAVLLAQRPLPPPPKPGTGSPAEPAEPAEPAPAGPDPAGPPATLTAAATATTATTAAAAAAAADNRVPAPAPAPVSTPERIAGDNR